MPFRETPSGANGWGYIDPERRWFWRGESDEEREFEFCGELVLLQWLLVIRGRDQAGAPLRLVLARDALNGDDWRRLQVALRYSR